ncbi:MAG: glycosyltransferase [Chloroflexi bacterium]|nr:glycosyltransferase [Chloroflexota bacterium]
MSKPRRLKLLIVLPTSPLPIFSGGRQRMYHTIRLLAARHDVTVASFWRDEEARLGLQQLAEELAITVLPVPYERMRPNRHLPSALLRRLKGRFGSLPADIYLWDQPNMHEAVNRVLATQPVDIIQVEWPYLSTYALAHSEELPTLLITHDIFSVALERRANVSTDAREQHHLREQATAWKHFERDLYPRFSAVGAMSAVDADFIRKRAPATNITLLANGVDTEAIPPGALRADANHLLFVGSPTHPPNLDGACWFLTEVWPDLFRQNLDLKLTLVNLNHPHVVACKQPGVTITGRLPDLDLVYQQADIVIVPLRAGSGTRLKILEAFAYGVPVASTTVGYEGLDVIPAEHLLVADTATAMAAAIRKLRADQSLRQRLATAGRRLAESKYAWSHIVAAQETLYFELLARDIIDP